jgi:hypothetical protein
VPFFAKKIAKNRLDPTSYRFGNERRRDTFIIGGKWARFTCAVCGTASSMSLKSTSHRLQREKKARRYRNGPWA